MFAVTCPAIDAPVLIWTSSIRRLTDTPKGIAVDFTCACGAPAVTMTGRAATTPWLVCHGEPVPGQLTPAHGGAATPASRPPELVGAGAHGGS